MSKSQKRNKGPEQARQDWDWSEFPAVIYSCQATVPYAPIFVSENVTSLIGYTAGELIAGGDFWIGRIHPDDLAGLMAEMEGLARSGSRIVTYRIRARDGGYRWIQNAISLVRDAAGNALHIAGVVTDVTQRRRAEDAIRNIDAGVSSYTGQKFFQSLVEHLARALDVQYAMVGEMEPGRKRIRTIAVFDRGEISSNLTYDLAGTPCENVVGQNLCVHSSRVCEKFPSDKMLAEWGAESYAGVPLFSVDHQPLGLMAVMDSKPLERVDLAESVLRIFGVRAAAELERRTAETLLAHNAFHDSLTNLPNRALFLDRLEQAVRRSRRRAHETVAVLFADLDRFKVVNDGLGHMAGDRLLAEVAGRLQACVRDTDTVARIGGDEFAVLLDALANAGESVEVAERIQASLKTPFLIEGREIVTSASIGIAASRPGAVEARELLRDADIAMYHAKERGRSRYEVFDAQMRFEAMEQLELEEGLRRAVDRGELELHYQPIVSLESGRIYALESLLRWRHPERGLLPAAEFVRHAEESGLIVPIGWWAIQAACRQARQWLTLAPEGSWIVTVNLSRRQFTQPDLIPRLAAMLEGSGLPPSILSVEITESVIMGDPDQIAPRLAQLKALGVGVMMDDFGTGYSSLGLLHQFPIDTLKIDLSVVADLESAKARARSQKP